MSIIKKTILMVMSITLILFTLVYIITNFIYMRGFQDLEKQTIEKNVNQVAGALSARLDRLNSFCLDWAEWDDTYYFALEYNQAYVNISLMDDTFIDNDVSLFLVINRQGEAVYGKSFDIPSELETVFPADLPDFFSYAVNEGQGEGFRSVMMVSGQPILVSCNPVFPSLHEGDSSGYLVTGRYIDAGLINFLSETTNLASDSIELQYPGENPELDNAMTATQSTSPIYVQTQKDDRIAGYKSINGVNGLPVFILKVSIPRDIHAQGMKVITYLHSSLLIIAIVFCGVFVYFFRYLILTRLTALGAAVNSIGSKGEISERIHIKGKDELSRLADNINGMLDSLENSETRRQSQKEIIGHIVSITPAGILVVNDAGYIVIINDAFRPMFGLNNRSMMGVKVDDLPELGSIAAEINVFRLSRLANFKKELSLVLDGSKKIFIANFARLKEEELYILYLTDITEERSRQESLYLTDRLASIGEMASGIAHELNNPLTSIIGLSEIVMRDEVPESVKEDMGLIKSESRRAAGIVRNLLSFARKTTAVKQPIHINKIIDDVLKLRSYEHGVNNIKVIKALDPELPEIMVDHSQIQQVFINIILNAEYAMATAHGKGSLTIKSETIGNKLRVTFTDDGPGIEPRNLRHIFDPFFTTKEAGKGTGLGLSICYGIVTAHNGNIRAVSEPGKGATFIIELPLHDSDTRETKTNT